jgi:SAM-dependent methyltransferase
MIKRFHKGSSRADFPESERLRFDTTEIHKSWVDYNLPTHILRYDFASKFVESKKTLDVACGNGYGSSYMLRYKPKIVVGVDYSRIAINEGKALFRNELLTLLVGDATDMGFSDKAFDVVVSFETLEHIRNQEKFLNEILRILRNDGVLIISTPNKDAFSAYDKFYYNRYHVRELTLSEFYSMLRGYFRKVDLYGQIQVGTIYRILRDIRRILAKKTGVDLLQLYRLVRLFPNLSDRSEQIYSLRTKRTAIPKFLIAVCRNNVSEGDLPVKSKKTNWLH